MSLFRKHNRKPFEKQLEEQLGDMEYKPSESLWDRIDSGITSDGFEKPVRSKLEQFEQIPYPETWKRIESRLPAQKQPVRRFVLFTAALIAFVGVVATVYIFNQQPQTPQLAVSTVNAPVQEDQIEIITPPSQTPQNITREGNVEANSPKQTSTAMGSEDAKPTGTPVNQRVQRKTQSKKSVPTSVVKAQSTQTITSSIISITPSNSSDQELTIPVPSQAAAAPAVLAASVLAPVPQSEPIASVPSSSSSTPAATQQAILSDTGKKVMAAAPADSSMNIKGREISNGVIAQPDTNKTVAHFDNEPDQDELTRFSISVFAGMSLSGTTYSSPKNSSVNFDENIKLRKQIERAEVDWSGSFMIDYRINDRWMVSAGLTMVNFNQKVQYDLDSAVNPSKPNDIGAPVTNPGDSFLVGNAYSNRIRYTWTEIPLMVNYTVHRGNRWDIDIQGGVGYAFISTIDGGMVSYDNKGVLVLKDKESFPQISNAVFATIQPQISKKFGQGVSVGIVPSFKYSVTSIIGNENWVQQHPYFIGLSACIRKRF